MVINYQKLSSGIKIILSELAIMVRTSFAYGQDCIILLSKKCVNKKLIVYIEQIILKLRTITYRLFKCFFKNE